MVGPLPNSFTNLDLNQWLLENLTKPNRVRGLDWQIVFGVVFDRLWWNRNEFIFKHKQKLVDHMSLGNLFMNRELNQFIGLLRR